MVQTEKGLLVSGVLLLALAALSGFVQQRYRQRAELFAEWRVVHAGGTAGAVQLLALGAVWQNFGQGRIVMLLEAGLIIATLSFFFGPMARALRRPRIASALLLLGAVVALPTYLALPLLLWL